MPGAQKPTSEKAPRSRGAAREAGAGARESGRPGAPSPEPRAPITAAARLRIPLRGLRRALGRRNLRFALVANGGWEKPVPGKYAAHVDPAHLGLGGLRVGGVGEWARQGTRAMVRVPRATRAAHRVPGSATGGSPRPGATLGPGDLLGQMRSLLHSFPQFCDFPAEKRSLQAFPCGPPAMGHSIAVSVSAEAPKLSPISSPSGDFAERSEED